MLLLSTHCADTPDIANFNRIKYVQILTNVSNFSVEDDMTMREIFMKDDGNTAILEEDHEFQLILHERDFVAGVQIITNIEKAVTKTRRMVMLLSRYIN